MMQHLDLDPAPLGEECHESILTNLAQSICDGETEGAVAEVRYARQEWQNQTVIDVEIARYGKAERIAAALTDFMMREASSPLDAIANMVTTLTRRCISKLNDQQ